MREVLPETRDRFEAWIAHFLPEARAEVARRQAAGEYIGDPNSWARYWAEALACRPMIKGEVPPAWGEERRMVA